MSGDIAAIAAGKMGDICKCGDSRHEHLEYGPREFIRRTKCIEFRLCVTERQMSQSYDACIKAMRSAQL